MKIGLDVSCLYEEDNYTSYTFFQTIKDLGFDGVELAVSNGKQMPLKEIKEMLEKTGLECTTGGGLTSEATIYDENDEIVEKGKQKLIEFVDTTYESWSLNSVPMYS